MHPLNNNKLNIKIDYIVIIVYKTLKILYIKLNIIKYICIQLRNIFMRKGRQFKEKGMIFEFHSYSISAMGLACMVTLFSFISFSGLSRESTGSLSMRSSASHPSITLPNAV